MRHISDGDYDNGFLFCKPFETIIPACDVFDTFDTVCSFLKDSTLSWEKFCGVFKYCAPATEGYMSGFQCLVLNGSPKIIRTH